MWWWIMSPFYDFCYFQSCEWLQVAVNFFTFTLSNSRLSFYRQLLEQLNVASLLRHTVFYAVFSHCNCYIFSQIKMMIMMTDLCISCILSNFIKRKWYGMVYYMSVVWRINNAYIRYDDDTVRKVGRIGTYFEGAHHATALVVAGDALRKTIL